MIRAKHTDFPNPIFHISFFIVLLVVLLSLDAVAQEVSSGKAVAEDDWPSLAYLRSDYKAVSAVAHIRIREAEITNRIIGKENWRVRCEVLESFKGKLRKGDVIEYFHGAEAGFPQKFFAGEKIVFLLAEYDKQKRALRYSVLENSTLPPTPERLRKLRVIRKSFIRTRARR